jgi:hypothetical protein
VTRAVGLALLATGALAAGPLGPAAAPAAEFNGYLQEAISVRTGEGDVIFHRQTFNVKFEENASRRVMFRFEVDAWRDDPEFLDDRVRTRLREGYLRLRFPDFDVRLGRVQVAWGTAEGVIIGDQVSPFDIENFIVPGFDEIRLGVDGVFVDYYFSLEYRLQALWISHFQPPDFPNPASPWFPADLDELEAPGFNVELQPFTRPANTFENSEFGFRFSGNPTVADFAIGYLRSWDDRPTRARPVRPVHRQRRVPDSRRPPARRHRVRAQPVPAASTAGLSRPGRSASGRSVLRRVRRAPRHRA